LTIRHEVMEGDWLEQIARCYGAALSAVQSANPRITDPNEVLKVSSVVVPKIGSAGTIYGPPCVVFYTVVTGDTGQSIANKFNADLNVLMAANPGVTLSPGVVVKVPKNSKGGTPVTQADGTAQSISLSETASSFSTLRAMLNTLTAEPTTEIDRKYLALGGPNGFLGSPAGPETGIPDGGSYRDFQGGSIYWSPETGAYEVHGEIRDRWLELTGVNFLGYPMTDETTTPDGIGRYNHFQNGSIYWSPDTGAHEVQGVIRDKWASLGWEKSFLGYPLTDETGTPNGKGRFNHFQGGSIYWSADTGAHEVQGVIRDKWASIGWEQSCLGFPTSDEQDYSDHTGQYTRISNFQGGTIVWGPNAGASVNCLSMIK